ncbi:hypothetical protein AB0F17_40050 [Nonomuraea sp. NPDC026600]|uniref:hypothetical protein n=1 Tax=Nonomuraea sp. NPDC026600 TaxID=3155363 RepID=UPI0033F9C35F
MTLGEQFHDVPDVFVGAAAEGGQERSDPFVGLLWRVRVIVGDDVIQAYQGARVALPDTTSMDVSPR